MVCAICGRMPLMMHSAPMRRAALAERAAEQGEQGPLQGEDERGRLRGAEALLAARPRHLAEQLAQGVPLRAAQVREAAVPGGLAQAGEEVRALGAQLLVLDLALLSEDGFLFPDPLVQHFRFVLLEEFREAAFPVGAHVTRPCGCVRWWSSCSWRFLQ